MIAASQRHERNALARCCAALAVAAILVGAALVPRAQAIEAFEGRLQIHGFAEAQVRALDRSYKEQLDLAQWYNVLNIEVEVDFAPDGFGPFDLFQGYARVEGRYDCVYSRGCGLSHSVNTFGDRSERLPGRLSDGRSNEFGGVIPVGNVGKFARGTVKLAPGNRPTRIGQYYLNSERNEQDDEVQRVRVRDGAGFPGFSTLLDQAGADNILGNDDDPGRYALAPFVGGAVRAIQERDSNGDLVFNRNGTPKFVAIAGDRDGGFKFGFADRRGGAVNNQLVLGPWLPKNFFKSVAALTDRGNPFRGRFTPSSTAATPIERCWEGDPNCNTFLSPHTGAVITPDQLDPRLQAILDDPIVFDNPNIPGVQLITPGEFLFNDARNGFFGGDYSGIVPCQDPSNELATFQINGSNANSGCTPNPRGTGAAGYTGPTVVGTNTKILGGSGENPLRPAPDRGNLDPTANADLATAQGLYVPSAGLINELRNEDFDTHDFNLRQAERAWNRGSSQQDQKELKEAYLDIEMLDSRLWMRLGLQNIVWGKTELFRTTDQFNPQDLALASLPSLEESRIALWAARFVYSLYEVGPFEDVRVEFAANFDQYEPSDLGACGEAFTPDLVCGITTGLFAHSFLGVGIAGVDRPPNPWTDISGIEIGGRVEWRWDRFSFAISDFYGYDDFPYPDQIFSFERNVDETTGRPRIAGSRGSCGSGAGLNGVTPITDPSLVMNGILTDRSTSVSGIGTEANCLKAGGAAGFANENQFGGLQNALENHSVNQQLFAWICSGTVGIAAGLDPGACAFTIFSSKNDVSSLLPIPFSEMLTTVFAGEIHREISFNFLRAVQSNQAGTSTDGPVPVSALNRDPRSPMIDLDGDTIAETNVGFRGDGTITAANPGINRGFLPPPFNAFPDRGPNPNDFLTLDSTMSNEQRALLGCGPFYGTRCDTSARINGFLGSGEIYPTAAGGGVDVLNMEASALLQSWPGIEGTEAGWRTTSGAAQPGTVGFGAAAACTRYVEGQGIVVLPGCRGLEDVELVRDGSGTVVDVRATFEDNYLPSVDGCVLAASIGGIAVSYNHTDPRLLAELRECATQGDHKVGNYLNSSTSVAGADTLWHPLAGCEDFKDPVTGEPAPNCGVFFNRDFESEFTNKDGSTSQIFRSEMAAFSWNFMTFLVLSSCGSEQRQVAQTLDRNRPPATTNPIRRAQRNGTDPECFDPEQAFRENGCSFVTPQACTNIKGFFGIAGTGRNTVKAGGIGGRGRRDFSWASGGQLVLRYEKRNVLGFAMDFAEDTTKSNWGVEFTWIEGIPTVNNNAFDNVSDVDAFNLTVSVDRPTFINFMNPNRTFFFNSQWFFQYLDGHSKGMARDKPFNVLFTFAVFTGYFQDRLMPNLVTVYDFNSQSGAVLPSIMYRFTDSFSMTAGMLVFWGHTQLNDMPVNGFAPNANRAGQNAYKDGTDNALSVIRSRDEIFLRIRWTF